MTRRWLLACAVAEAVGMSAAAAAARGAMALDDHGVAAATVLGLLLVVTGGLVEGAALGWFQSRALADRLGPRGRARWLAVTVLVAGVGWAAASTPAALGPDTASQPPLLTMMLAAAGLGLVMGAVLGAAQVWAWSARVRHPARWIFASAVGWLAAMPVVFAGATLPDADWPTPAVVLDGTVTGLVAGTVLGLVTGPFLDVLDGPRLRHRLVLAVLGTRLVHPADRDGDGGLVGLALTGSRSGRVYRFPVAAARPAPDVLVVLPGRAERKTWWRNLPSRPDVEVLVDGHWTPARAQVLRCGDPRWDAARTAYLGRYPHVRSSGQPLVRLALSSRDQGPASPGPVAVGSNPVAS